MFDLQSNRVGQILQHVITAQIQGSDVGVEQLLFALVLLGKELGDFLGVDIQKNRQRANVNNVLEELALPRVGVIGVADFCQGDTNDTKIIAKLRCRNRAGGVVKKVTAG